jgi:methylisocitrate lyase
MTPTFKQLIKENKPLSIVGITNPYTALMVQKVGFKAIYLSGGATANSGFGVPDTGITTCEEVAYEAMKITDNELLNIPLLVDIDTGWGDPKKAILAMEEARVSAVHMEDQVADMKRCGHLEGKQIVPIDEMVDRIEQAISGRGNKDLFIFARTDAVGDEAIKRAVAYEKAGVDGIFAEGISDINEYDKFKKALKVPILANITEYGKTPLYTPKELAEHGVDCVLFPRTLERAMNAAAEKTAEELFKKGSVQALIDSGEIQHRNAMNELIAYDMRTDEQQKQKEEA